MVMSYSLTQVDLKGIMLTENGQPRKATYSVSLFM